MIEALLDEAQDGKSLFPELFKHTGREKEKRQKRKEHNEAQKCNKKLNQGEKQMSGFIRNEHVCCWKTRTSTLTKKEGNSMYQTKQYAMGNLRIYLSEITEVEIKFQNDTLNQEVHNIW